MVEIKRTRAGQSFINKQIGVVNTRENKVDQYQAQANTFFQLSQTGLRLAENLGRKEAREYAMGAPLEARDENGTLLPVELPEGKFFGSAGREDAKKILDDRYLAKWKIDTSKAFNDFAKANPKNPKEFKKLSGDLLSQTQAVLKEQGDEALADIIREQGYGLASQYALKIESNALASEDAESLADAKNYYSMIAGDMAQRFANGEISLEKVNALASDIARNAEGIFGASPRYARDLQNTIKRSVFERKMEVSFRGKSQTEISTAILDLRTNNTDSKIAKEEPELFAAFQQIPEQSRDGAESEMNSVRQMVFNEQKENKEAADLVDYLGNGGFGSPKTASLAFAQITGADTSNTASFLMSFNPESLNDPVVQKLMVQSSSLPDFLIDAVSHLREGMIDQFPGGQAGALTMIDLANNFTLNPDGTRRYKGLSEENAYFLNGFSNLINRYGIARAAELHEDAKKIVSNDTTWLGIIRAKTEYEGTSVYEGAKRSLMDYNPGIQIADLEEFVYPYAKQLAIPGIDAETAAETVAQIYMQKHVEDRFVYLAPGRQTEAYPPAYYFKGSTATAQGFIEGLLSPDTSRHGRFGKFNKYLEDTVVGKIKELPGGRYGTMPSLPRYGRDFFVKPNPNNDAKSGSFVVVNHEGTPVLDVNGQKMEFTTKGAEKMFRMKTNQALIAENLESEQERQKREVDIRESLLMDGIPQFGIVGTN